MAVDEEQLVRTVTRVAGTLRAAGFRFAVTGGCAVYAYGGPPSDHDVDVLVKEEDALAARSALVEAGMRAVDPPEDWLTKVYDGDCLVDLIFRPNQRDVNDELLDQAEVRRIGPVTAPVMPATWVMIDKLGVLGPHRCDYTALLSVVRAVREQLDWVRIARETADSPYATAFLRLAAELDLTGPQAIGSTSGKGTAHVRAS